MPTAISTAVMAKNTADRLGPGDLARMMAAVSGRSEMIRNAIPPPKYLALGMGFMAIWAISETNF
jgi:hypothetical protein